jgi:F420-non-reducing hydrogenase iron-sulfur subunit
MANGDEVFEPEILGIACNWCGYGAADQAGSVKIQYPANIRILRVMCTGMVDPYLILRGFELGFDGVILVGCHEGDCHYVSGNESAKEIVDRTCILIDALGLDKKRLRIEAASSSEGPEFARIANEFTDEIRMLGPNPLKQNGGSKQ